MKHRYRDRVLALAGVFQAAHLVQQLSHQGRTNAEAFFASINSVFMLEAGDTPEVYGGEDGVAVGLKLLRDKLRGGSDPSDLEMARYVIAMIQLEGGLKRHPKMLGTIRAGIEAAEAQMKFFNSEPEDDAVHPRLIEKLAELYSQTLSTLTPRIMVSGEQGFLANPTIAAKVRASLLAGIRSAFLWRQLGGTRWQLLLRRRRIADEAGRLLSKLSPGNIA